MMVFRGIIIAVLLHTTLCFAENEKLFAVGVEYSLTRNYCIIEAEQLHYDGLLSFPVISCGIRNQNDIPDGASFLDGGIGARVNVLSPVSYDDVCCGGYIGINYIVAGIERNSVVVDVGF